MSIPGDPHWDYARSQTNACKDKIVGEQQIINEAYRRYPHEPDHCRRAFLEGVRWGLSKGVKTK